MKKLAVISSWDEPCGIATYAECLIPEFKNYYETDILPLNTEVLQNSNRNIMKIGDRLIDEIAQKVKNYDCVNIQFEVGLFGVDRNQVYERVMKLVRASRNIIITFHSINLDGGDLNLRKFISTWPIKVLMNYKRENYWSDFYMKLFTSLKKLSKTKNVHIIVHNKRDCDKIKKMVGFQNVHDFPLGMYSKEIRNRERTVEKRKEFLSRYNLNEDTVVLGTFGFVSLYKGHETLIKALSLLPNNYKMIVFGAQHIRSIKPFKEVDEYLSKLLQVISDKDAEISKVKNTDKIPLHDRIIFAGSVTDEEFQDAMAYSDFVVLPYLEVKQMASGVATTALESKARVIMSNTNCFNELKRYYPHCFKQFDIGNYLELVHCIKNWKEDYSSNIEKSLEKYNLEENVKNYHDIFEGINHEN